MPYGDPAKYITRLFVDETCCELPYAREIMQRSGLPVTVLGKDQEPPVAGSFPGNLHRGKQSMLLCRNKGRFFKPCPGTREYNCCAYQVLNIGMNCPMDCVYCILQAYLNNPWLSFFVNIEDMFAELQAALTAEPGRFFRIGTGEFTDSLAIDNLTGLSRHLVPFMSRQKNAVLELKTKSAVVDNLQDLAHGSRTVVAWSVNAPLVMQQEEIRTASLDERLAAAVRCVDWGYRVAFHFDPIIWHHGWQQGYRETIERIFTQIPREKIVWISLGALRYLPPLKRTATLRFPGSRFFYEEFVEGLDGKSRYFRSRRREMYSFLVNELNRHRAEKTCIYFCMESDVLWREVLGFTPTEKGGLAALLDRALDSA